MPLYDYRCRDCGHEFEIQQSISEDSLTECPECKGSLRKVFAPVGISFKGSGFYKNDSAGSRSDSGSSGDSGKGDSGKGDSGKGDSAGSGGGSSTKESASTSAASD